MKLVYLKKISIFFYFKIALLLTACAVNGPRIVNHSFQFDAISDSSEIEILDYRYGESKNPGARPPDWALKTGHIGQGAGITGPMVVGDSLYVKWKIRKTGGIYQDTVDLRQRLPYDIEDHIIRFLVKDSQLNIYVISRKELKPNPCMMHGDPRKLAKVSGKADDIVYGMYCSSEILKIYPDGKKLP